MSVYTSLTLADIGDFIAARGQAPALSMTPIKNGIENSNWFIEHADGEINVLTVFEALDANEAAFLGPLLQTLRHHQVPVAAPLCDAQGQFLGQLAQKPAQLAPRLLGAHPISANATVCADMGRALARLHCAPLATWQRAQAHGAAWWDALAAQLRPHFSAEDRALLQAVQTHYHATVSTSLLPQGFIHGDLFRDNSLFVGDTLTGILDFSEAAVDYFLLDIAITLNDFCRDWEASHPLPDPERERAFLTAYGSVRPLTLAERDALPIFLTIAAMRFWLSRADIAARNLKEGRISDTILQKDPKEMRDLCALRFQACGATSRG